MYKKVVIWLALLAACFVATPKVFGCSQMGSGSPKDSYTVENAVRLAERADYIFVGRLTHNVPQIELSEGQTEEVGYVTIFSVSRGWKLSEAEAEQRIEYRHTGTCQVFGRTPSVGKQYLVFVLRDGARWFEIPDAEHMVEALGPVSYTVRRGLVRYVHN